MAKLISEGIGGLLVREICEDLVSRKMSVDMASGCGLPRKTLAGGIRKVGAPPRPISEMQKLPSRRKVPVRTPDAADISAQVRR